MRPFDLHGLRTYDLQSRPSKVFVTDLGNYKVRRIRGDVVTTVAGSGTAGYLDHDVTLMAQFCGLEGICGKSDGSMLYVSDGGRGEDVPYNYIRQIKL